jgi:uncharacterized protein YbjQ (UPF0145 family)
MVVIKEALGVKKKEEVVSKTVNQQIYKEIRGLMDTASEKYRREKEVAKQREEMIGKMKQEYMRRLAIKKQDIPT